VPVSFLGYHLADWDLTKYVNLGLGSLLYNVSGKLATAGGDHRAALAGYEQAVRGYAPRHPKARDRIGRFLAPRTKLGRQLRNRLLSGPPAAKPYAQGRPAGWRQDRLKDYPG
jgi:hypothetical protein